MASSKSKLRSKSILHPYLASRLDLWAAVASTRIPGGTYTCSSFHKNLVVEMEAL